MLITRNMVGRFLHVERQSGEAFNSREDLTIFVPDPDDDIQNWVCTIEGSPDDPARAFSIRNIEELRAIMRGLQTALNMIEGRGEFYAK